MTDNMKALLKAASADESLKKALDKAGDSKEAVIAAAKAHGLTLTEQDFSPKAMKELSHDEMRAVAGGISTDFCTCTDKGSGTEGDLSCVCNGSGEGVNINNQHFRCGCFSTLGAGLGVG